MFPPAANYVGRRVITFHNQRDFVFVRQHRYMPDSFQVSCIDQLAAVPRVQVAGGW